MTAASYVFAFVVLLSILIFVHELGHFLVAKAFGVRVLKFSLGFGPPVGFGRFRLAWKRGPTEYVIAWFPLGGFVKMLGEQPGEEEDAELRAHPSEALGAKPVWQKLAIVFAGPAMNLALPIAVFAVTLAAGLPRADSVIGLVEAGSPAAEAGLHPGDRITAVDGAPVEWWADLEEEVRSEPGRTLRLDYTRERRHGSVQLQVATRSGFNEFGEIADVGWVGLGHARRSALLGIPRAESPAHRSGLRSGDRVTQVAGEPVEDWRAFEAAYAAAGSGGEVPLAVERGEEGETLSVTVPALGDVSALGVVPASVLVSQVEPDSPAARAGLEAGDLVVAANGEPVRSFASFAALVSTGGGAALDLAIARDGRSLAVRLEPELIPTDLGMGIEEPRYRIGIRGSDALLTGAVELDQERNPLVSIPRAAGMTVEITRTFLRGLGKLITGEVSRRQVAGPIGIAQIAGSALQRGWEAYLSTLVLISINLGILNLLPIPILDGGQALLFAVEGVKRSPLSVRTREIVQQVGLAVLVLIMGMAFWNDISRHWSKVVDWLRSSGL